MFCSRLQVPLLLPINGLRRNSDAMKTNAGIKKTPQHLHIINTVAQNINYAFAICKTFNCLPTFMNAAIALSKCCCWCAALNCTRIRACPFATTG
jgi:hypothetical protein